MGWMRGLPGIVVLLLGTATGVAGTNGLEGDWKTPGGSIVRVGRCEAAICLTVVKVSPTAKGSTDAKNPDSALRSRPVCGLRIGDGFKVDGADGASDGHIYDPESGKTYRSKMTRDGDQLKLRGYVGVSLFGRTEVWTRTETVEACGKR